MKILHSYQETSQLPEIIHGSSIAIGTFDGIHAGHQAVMACAQRTATNRQLCSLLLTFEPHPVRLLAPALAPPRIYSLEDKRTLIAQAGFDLCLEQTFDEQFIAMKPLDFIHKVLNQALHARFIAVGYDFSFGAHREGSPELLQNACPDCQVTVLPPQSVGHGLVVSSTKIRVFLHEGRVDAAALALGRPYHINGRVVSGEQRGRTMGFPTANLATSNELIPPNGTYATWFSCEALGPTPRPAITHIGQNPTFHQGPELHIETHVFGECPDLYGQQARLFFAQKLREERRFEDASTLAQQIHTDIERARAVLQNQPSPQFI